MASFEALRLIRQKRGELREAGTTQLVEVIQRVRADHANHDFEAALELDALVGTAVDTADYIQFYRLCIESCIFGHRPIWARTIAYGRKSFVQKLERDAAQCFESSGLMEDPPSEAIVEWWDSVAGRTRALTDAEKLQQARAAERLSLEHERKRLRTIGIKREPVWMSIDDNWAGYDILSFDHSASGVTSRMIEVKSTVVSPMRFFLTRNEWKKCLEVGDAYIVHAWDMRSGQLFIRTADQIADHVPEDRGNGLWASVEIRLGSS